MTTEHNIATKKRSAAGFSSGPGHSLTDGDAFATLCQHVISHLPDSIARRRAVLAALILCAPRSSPLIQHIREMQWHLQAHLRLSDVSPKETRQFPPISDPTQ